MVATWQNEPNAPKEERAGLGNHFQRERANMTKAVLGIIGGSGISVPEGDGHAGTVIGGAGSQIRNRDGGGAGLLQRF